MPAPRVKPLAEVAAKWARRAGSAGQEYTAGVTGAGARWAAGATAAAQTYTQAVTAAAQQGRYGKGVAKAGAAKFERGATEKGPARYSQGVAVAEQDYSGGLQPYLQAIGSIDLPARGPTGSDANYERVRRIGTALRQLKVGR